METLVYCTFQQEGFHRWAEAPKDVLYLRNTHRHLFHFTVKIEVRHDDRELEFITLKKDMHYLAWHILADRTKSYSCEQIGMRLLQSIHDLYGTNRDVIIDVSEDGENGALVIHEASDCCLQTEASEEERRSVQRHITSEDEREPPYGVYTHIAEQ